MDGFIDIRKLNIDELMGVVNLYPWFGGARKELCRRLTLMGRGDTAAPEFADAAMHIGDRAKLYQLFRTQAEDRYADADVAKIIKAYIAQRTSDSDTPEDSASESSPQRKVIVAGGDFFSKEEYEKEKRSEDNVFSRYAAKAKKEDRKAEGTAGEEFDLYTETLARIYADQGYYEQAKHIYSKLLLAYPEKNAYFAALIENLEKINNQIL